MQPARKSCQAIPADADETPNCPYHARVSSFCRQHAEELRTLEEREQIAAREIGRLKPIVDELIVEGADAYIRVRDIRKDERIVRLYSESLEEQIDAAVALETRFFSEAEDRDSETLAVLEERKATVEASLMALQERAYALEREPERQQGQETAASPSEGPEPIPVVPITPVAVPVADRNLNEPPAYHILNVPHPPCACTANTSDTSNSRPISRYNRTGWCTAIKLRDGLQCMWLCVSGQRLCKIHCVAHRTIVVPHRVKEGMLEAQRMRVARGEGDRARRVADVKHYIGKLDEMEGIVKEHQRLFFCRSAESYLAILEDLKARRISAGLLLGELSGRKDARIAEEQGRAEAWTTEFLAEIQQKDVIERRQEVEDLLTGAFIHGAVRVVWLTTGAKRDRGRGLLVRGGERPRRHQPLLTAERDVLMM
ncbi:hypothetical protein V8D89_004648 [Ganoderma adspersum]